MAGISDKIFMLIKDAVEDCGVELWDVRYLKEGASWYLRVFIDKDSGIGIDDCTNVSHAIDPIIDQADPIKDSYYLEVCSPGIERELTRPEHFKKFSGHTVRLKLYKAIDSKKEFTGTLEFAGEEVILLTQGCELKLKFSDISKANLCDF